MLWRRPPATQQTDPLHHGSGDNQASQCQEDGRHSHVQGVVQPAAAVGAKGFLDCSIFGRGLRSPLKGGVFLVQVPDGGQEADSG